MEIWKIFKKCHLIMRRHIGVDGLLKFPFQYKTNVGYCTKMSKCGMTQNKSFS